MRLTVGNMHGSNEVAPAFASLICQLTTNGSPTTVALEIWRSEQPRIDAFLQSEGRKGDVEKLTDGPFWRRALQDGRSSEAMVRLLEALRTYRSMGRTLRVVAFDVDGDWKPTTDRSDERDQELARALQAEIDNPAIERVIALTGNIHARTQNGVPWDDTFVPMAARLLGMHTGKRLFSLNAVHQGGSTWACISTSQAVPPKCEAWPQKGSIDAPTSGLEIGADRDPMFHGALFVGPITASRPHRATEVIHSSNSD